MPKAAPMTSLSNYDLDRSPLRSQAEVWSHEDDPARRRSLDHVRDILPRLPALDRDILRLYVVEGLTQRQIRGVLGITQQGVCKRLSSAIRRAEFLVGQPDILPHLPGWLKTMLPEPERTVLAQFAVSGHQAAVARSMGLSSQWVNCLYLRGLQQLLDHGLMGHYLVTWFTLLSMQRYIYDRDTPAVHRSAAPRRRARSAPGPRVGGRSGAIQA